MPRHNGAKLPGIKSAASITDAKHEQPFQFAEA
jgi:hypothetical protein